MTWTTWGVFVVTELLLCLTPGPAVLRVVSQGLAHGARQAFWADVGSLTGNAVYFALSGAGLGVLLVASHHLFAAVK